MSLPKLFVVGGNGFLGSAICRAGVAKGWEVSSMSSSGTPYTTPAGHTPTWVHSVKWHKASAFEPDSYSSLIGSSTAVVHTLGILLEDAGYKKAVRDGSPIGMGKALVSGLFGTPSPLRSEKERRAGYEGMNRDSALKVLNTYLSSIPVPATSVSEAGPSSSSSSSSTSPHRSFIYISAADCFRPLIPRRYIETKRQAESGIRERCASASEAGVTPFFMRPGLLYHPHIRPISTLPAFLLSLSAGLHDRINFPLPLDPNGVLGGAAAGLRTHPLHVDHVASAVLRCIESPGEAESESIGREGRGIVDVGLMRRWSGLSGEREIGQGAGADLGAGAHGMGR